MHGVLKPVRLAPERLDGLDDPRLSLTVVQEGTARTLAACQHLRSRLFHRLPGRQPCQGPGRSLKERRHSGMVKNVVHAGQLTQK